MVSRYNPFDRNNCDSQQPIDSEAANQSPDRMGRETADSGNKAPVKHPILDPVAFLRDELTIRPTNV